MYRNSSSTLTIHNKHFTIFSSINPSMLVLVIGAHRMNLHELWILIVHEEWVVIIREHSLAIFKPVEIVCRIIVFLFDDGTVNSRALWCRRWR